LDKDTGSAVLCGNLWTKKETTTYTANTDKSHLFSRRTRSAFYSLCGWKCVFENASLSPLDKCAVLYRACW